MEKCEFGIVDSKNCHIADVSIAYEVEEGIVGDIYADEDITITVDGKKYEYEKGDCINVDGDESLIRSEDITIWK